jgi:ribonuclease VapC
MAIVLNEPAADPCIAVLEANDQLFISAGTIAEALIVAGRRNVGREMSRLIDNLGFDIVDVTSTTAVRVAEAYRHWGRGVHPAALNFGDCFAYDVASELGLPLLYVGGDFARTDLRSALSPT